MSEPNEFQKLKDRLHNLNDWKQDMIKDFAVMQYRLTELEDGSEVYATKEQLKAAIDGLGAQIKSAGDRMADQIATLKLDIEPLKKALYWAIGVVISAVILAVMALILKGPA